MSVKSDVRIMKLTLENSELMTNQDASELKLQEDYIKNGWNAPTGKEYFTILNERSDGQLMSDYIEYYDQLSMDIDIELFNHVSVDCSVEVETGNDDFCTVQVIVRPNNEISDADWNECYFEIYEYIDTNYDIIN